MTANKPSPAPTVSVEEALTRAVRKADEEFERVGGSSRHWVRDCFLPAIEAEGLCVSRITGAATREDVIEECASLIENAELLFEIKGKPKMISEMQAKLAIADTLERAAAMIRSLASHPASEAGDARPSFEEVRKAFYSVPGDGSMKSLDDGLRAVMALYERGAK